MFSLILPIILTWFSTTCHAQSWVECTSYNHPSFTLPEYSDIGNFNRSLCTGYPRDFAKQYKGGFGVDTGYSAADNGCSRFPINHDYYTKSALPMAKYKAGQMIYISHPARNNVADYCSNAFLHTARFAVYVSMGKDVDTFDLPLAIAGNQHINGIVDHVGSNRCYNFCGNKEKAHCISGWTLPSDISEGVHSFKWTWEFKHDEIYSSCFDALIVGPSEVIETYIKMDSENNSNDISSSDSSPGSITQDISTPGSDEDSNHSKTSRSVYGSRYSDDSINSDESDDYYDVYTSDSTPLRNPIGMLLSAIKWLWL